MTADYLEPMNQAPQRRPRAPITRSFLLRGSGLIFFLATTSGCGLLGDSGTDGGGDGIFDYEPEYTYQPQRPLPDAITTFAPFEDTLQPDNSLPDEYDSYSPASSEEKVPQD